MKQFAGLTFSALCLPSCPMPSRVAQLLVVTTLILLIGAHWAVLQTVAWIGMAVSYSQRAPLMEALQKTFDGHHPCQLCKAVTEGKKSEQKHAALKLETKLDLFCLSEGLTLQLAPPVSLASDEFASAPARAEPPPSPPPRLA